MAISSTLVGSINNVNIGENIAGTGKFTDLIVTGTTTFTNTFLTPAPVTTGTIDNYNIGLTTKGSGAFTVLSADALVTLSSATTGSMDNVAIGQTTAAAGQFTTVSITDTPTALTHATTKQYVDNKISAFAIALGS